MYFYKKYYPINLNNDKICCGIPSTANYCEIDFSEDNLNLLNFLIDNGISLEDIKSNELYSTLFQKNLIDEKKGDEIKEDNRNALFIQYLLGRDLTNSEETTKILIFGAGAGGSSVCYQLCQIGFVSIHIIDFDIVQASDVSKTLVYDQSDINEYKVVALKNKIKNNFNTEIAIYTDRLKEMEEMERFISKVNPDLIINAADPGGLFRFNLNTICYSRVVPFICMSYSFIQLNIGPFYIPGFTACDEHLNDLLMEIYGKHYNYKGNTKRLFSDKLIHPSTTILVNILSSLIAMEVLFFITKKFKLCKSLGKLVVLNPISFAHKSYQITDADNCSICSKLKQHNDEKY